MRTCICPCDLCVGFIGPGTHCASRKGGISHINMFSHLINISTQLLSPRADVWHDGRTAHDVCVCCAFMMWPLGRPKNIAHSGAIAAQPIEKIWHPQECVWVTGWWFSDGPFPSETPPLSITSTASPQLINRTWLWCQLCVIEPMPEAFKSDFSWWAISPV